MAARGTRKSDDLDIIVKQDLWYTLLSRYSDSLHHNPTCLKIGNIEVYKDWPELSDKINKMIDTADIIANFPYVQLKYVIEWKNQFGRGKDIKDLKLIQEYYDGQK